MWGNLNRVVSDGLEILDMGNNFILKSIVAKFPLHKSILDYLLSVQEMKLTTPLLNNVNKYKKVLHKEVNHTDILLEKSFFFQPVSVKHFVVQY